MPSKIDRREFLISSGAAAGLVALTPSPSHAKAAQIKLRGLKVDYLDRPLGLENPHPKLSWQLESGERNVRQSAYRVVVARSKAAAEAGRGEVWNSGKITSNSSFGIPYQGQPLASRERCWWSVQVWDERDAPSALSAASWWEMGLLGKEDWSAQWLAVEDSITRADREFGLRWIWGASSQDKVARRFRFKFRLPEDSREGRFFAVANGFWIAAAEVTGIWIDGKRCTSDWPRIPSMISGVGIEGDNDSGRPVTLEPLSAGEHVIAVEVKSSEFAPGTAAGLTFFARLQLASGEIVRIGSHTDWKTTLASEHEDRWNTRDYDDGKWESAVPAPFDEYQPWLGLPAMCLRREFSIKKRPIKARLYATALGAYEARLNGKRVGDALLTPEISQYAKRVLYRVYDVSAMLSLGQNVLGLTVADGWYASFDGYFTWGPAPRRVLVQLELSYADGSRELIATGPGWRTTQSPIQAAEIRIGEIYDARLEQPGWDAKGFDDAHWEEAQLAATPACRIVSQVSPPIRVQQILKPRSISQPKAGVHVLDFGQNFAGWCRLHVRAPKGTKIEFEFSEALTPEGGALSSFYSTGERKRDIFIASGNPAGETFEPHFTYRGFRYVQITGLIHAPSLESVQGIFIYSDLPVAGQLRTDSELMNQIWHSVVRTQQSNFVAIPTDCPSREQRGWIADAAIFWDAAAFNMDVYAFTRRQLDNVMDDVDMAGPLPGVAPEPQGYFSGRGAGPAWSEGNIILVWTLWRRYGDLTFIEQHWDAMDRYMKYLQERNPNYLGRNEGLADWIALDQPSVELLLSQEAPRETLRDLISTAYWAHAADLLSQMADATGRTQDAARLRAVFERIREAFNQTYVKPDGTVGKGSQTSYCLALQFGLLSKDMRQRAAQRLAADIRERGVALTTGILGTQFILDVLADAGFVDLAYGLLLRTEYPSWGYKVRNGGTTMWENWSGKLKHLNKTRPLSLNHYALASVGGFLFRRVAGIDAATPGFETIVIRPALDERVKRGGGDYDSIMGRISTDWTHARNGSFTLDVLVPANTKAYVHLPAQRNSRIKEGHREVSGRMDLRVIDRRDLEAVIEVGSGAYRFVVEGRRG